MIFDLDAINVAGSSLTRADKGLLFLAEGVEEAGFADVGAADEGDFEEIVGYGSGDGGNGAENGGFEGGDSLSGGGGNPEDLVGFDAEAQEFGFGEGVAEVGFVEEEEDGFAGLQGFLGDVAIALIGIFAAVEGE